MKIHFWGVRGSIPTPLSPQQIRQKIDAVVERITPQDIAGDEDKKRFLASLPKWLYGTTGGNTPCVEVTTADNSRLILDAGSGIRVLGKQAAPPENAEFHILMSHLHWDHIQGLPFFDYAFRKDYTLHIYSANPQAKDIFRQQMTAPLLFPVPLEAFTPNLYFHTVEAGYPFTIGSSRIITKKMKHPGASYAYAITDRNKKFIYATDVELTNSDFERTRENTAFFENAAALVVDAQYLVGEAIQKENWGHSPFCYAIDFADFWKIGSLYLFHHEPEYDDERLDAILKSAQWYSDTVTRTHVRVYKAEEDVTVQI
ncbi:MAG: MBL fold metallo-hydrolase [Treponema sp.]|jgi:phosphoribosyl 1,2-cyclic phosphodiesterase|nr:MBL fold metallo-hydrolase [Treponema sp.]